MSVFKSLIIIGYSALLLTACQPTTADPSDNAEQIEASPIIDADSVTMTADRILDVKPSRYQPSLGLQGQIIPVEHAKLTAAQPLVIEKTLVASGQWVKKGAPLLIVHQLIEDLPTPNSEEPTAKLSTDSNQSIRTEQTSRVDKNQADETASLDTAFPDTASLDDSAVVTKQDADDIDVPSTPIVIRARFAGRVDELYVSAAEQVAERAPLLSLSNDRDLQFIATLPMKAKPRLSVGQTVNFTTDNMTNTFTGQISKLASGQMNNQLLVHVHVINNETNQSLLKPKMIATGRVDYGQIDVGAIVPKTALHDVDLTPLQAPPYQALSPLNAHVWIIKQDQRLTRQPVEVISYDPKTKQYLIAGITNDSLIGLVDLPVSSAGKRVIVS